MLKLQWRRMRSRYPLLQIIQTWRCWVLILFILVLLLYIIVAFRKQPITLLEEEIHEINLGNIEFDFRTGLYFLKEGKDVFLRGSFPDTLQLKGSPTHCGTYNASRQLCVLWYPHVKLEVLHTVDEHANCHSMTWTPLYNNYQPQTCFSMADSNWYGGSLLSKQNWPLNKAQLLVQPFVTHDLKSYKGEENVIGNILDWFWINSGGVAVILDNTLPLHISVNQSGDNLLCFYSTTESKTVLKYNVCKSKNLRKIHRYVTSKTVHLPISLPSQDVFTKPLWSTNPSLGNEFNQASLMKYAKEVADNAFERYSMEIYDETISIFKTDPFDSSKFQNSVQLLMYLRGDYGFKVFVSISPFLSKQNETQYKSKLILDTEGNPLVTKVNGKDMCVVNLFDEKVFDWFAEKAKQFKDQYQLDGVRLIGGESNYLLANTLGVAKVNKLSTLFSKFAADILKLPIISSFASHVQEVAGLTYLTSFKSSWGEGGLQSVIPSVLTLSLLGYPFIIPNSVGGPGNMELHNTVHLKPDQELYIRWMAVSAYMPCMMFSFPPWAYDQTVIDVARQFVKIHEEIVSPLVIKAAREYEISGSPIIRPLWWIDPTDATSQIVSDEYLIGESFLVAPVLQQGKTYRDIYIPSGKWKDMLNNKEVEGKTWLKEFEVKLDQVATFSMIK